ncbi:guanylate kinase [candidate division WOR-1 bacterium RIFOXYB2_FULL_42_35]|uniref:Guanylate kinase n=1 Tax=candidate division WOR-1 bacterium RIFOXYC2_FULL_41_25 TaxID=1802586 RepID=A0A1F4TJW8_UNCSA|nr:MAG: guanylate kinase [candidate division WOR-1 bacterium RIFOXYA2_FULL_41_14]OGC23489.1 MAG: guanylate kinase [candidate division WOR-1 bacterium RIFOXYB2_FULL_42_35]OGC33012.1 MAG: guanylate kinase [candidate division WOR-1 bacterium RIFOXYC2_FULL_41_25]OGC44126.1 MAG: guanylate kinase [candidate division WOR-1 bacterium RIFOXYD2_FULL_41_8]
MAKKARKKRGILVVVSGPSGVGKSTVVRRILKLNKNIKLSVSATTRPPRPGETHGEHYYFLSQEEFDQKVRNNEFVEWAKVHGYYYGTLVSTIKEQLIKGGTTVCEVDVQGAASIKEVLGKGKLKTATVFIFLIPPSVDILAFRLKKRKTENLEVVNYRLRAAIAELQVMEKYDYIVVNDRVESAAEKIQAIINVEKERTLLN